MIAPLDKDSPFTLSVQAVLYRTARPRLEQALESIANAVEVARRTWNITTATVLYGDSGDVPSIDASWLTGQSAKHTGLKIEYHPFGRNLGHTGGQNELFAKNDSDICVVSNPDVVLEGACLRVMLETLAVSDAAMVEARQLPVEHPKSYDAVSGATSWVSGAFFMAPRSALAGVGYFDSQCFFMQCDDVDLSWRVRKAGHRIVYQPAAAVFHDKRLGDDAGWLPTATEVYYSAEGALMLHHKWGGIEQALVLAAQLKASGSDPHIKAACNYENRLAAGKLPAPVEGGDLVANFVNGNFGAHRFVV